MFSNSIQIAWTTETIAQTLVVEILNQCCIINSCAVPARPLWRPVELYGRFYCGTAKSHLSNLLHSAERKHLRFGRLHPVPQRTSWQDDEGVYPVCVWPTSAQVTRDLVGTKTCVRGKDKKAGATTPAQVFSVDWKMTWIQNPEFNVL